MKSKHKNKKQASTLQKQRCIRRKGTSKTSFFLNFIYSLVWIAFSKRRNETARLLVGLLVGCLTSQQHASVSQGRICSDNFTCCHTETEVADQTFYLTQSQYTDSGPTSPSTDPIPPGAWQGSHWSANFEVTGVTRPGKIPSQAGFELRTFRFRGGRLNH